MKRALTALIGCLALSACATPAQHAMLASGSTYVAMGSSYAAGPSIGIPADTPQTRCGRSSDNYAHQLMRLRHLTLIDVSCSGATTDHLLGPWDKLPPQLDALSSDTKLVTITIGGNDVGFVGGLFANSCKGALEKVNVPAPNMCKAITGSQNPAAAQARAIANAPVTEEKWQMLSEHFDRIIAEVHRRAPMARLIFVDYVTVIPTGPLCDTVPLTAEGASTARMIAKRLSQLTADAAKRGGADILAASALSKNHDACATDPWSAGFTLRANEAAGTTPYHPNLAGMTAIAGALDKMLGGR